MRLKVLLQLAAATLLRVAVECLLKCTVVHIFTRISIDYSVLRSRCWCGWQVHALNSYQWKSIRLWRWLCRQLEYDRRNDALEFADGSVPSYVPGTYPSVKITRTLRADYWATAVYPFAVSGVDKIAVLDNYNTSTQHIRFVSAEASTANEPFLMRSTTNKSEISLSNVEVSATSANPTVTSNNLSVIGTYSEID